MHPVEGDLSDYAGFRSIRRSAAERGREEGKEGFDFLRGLGLAKSVRSEG